MALGKLIRCIISGRGLLLQFVLISRIAGAEGTQSLELVSFVSLGESPLLYRSHVGSGSDPSQRMSEGQVSSAHRLWIVPSRGRGRGGGGREKLATIL